MINIFPRQLPEKRVKLQSGEKVYQTTDIDGVFKHNQTETTLKYVIRKGKMIVLSMTQIKKKY